MSSLINETQNVYKRIPGESNENKPIRKVRGLYVTGQYLPIEYENNLLNITKVVCTPSTAVDYIETSISKYTDPIFSVSDVSVSFNPDVVNFYLSNTTKKIDSIFAISDVSWDPTPNILACTQDNISKKIDSIFAVTDVTWNPIPSISLFYKASETIGDESMLMVRRHILTTASISDII